MTDNLLNEVDILEEVKEISGFKELVQNTIEENVNYVKGLSSDDVDVLKYHIAKLTRLSDVLKPEVRLNPHFEKKLSPLQDAMVVSIIGKLSELGTFSIIWVPKYIHYLSLFRVLNL